MHRSEDDLRRRELELVRPWLLPGARILELGSGTGLQASTLASWGHPVLALDLPARERAARFHPVVEYDGRQLPVASGVVDVVYSSNVLEHVKDLDALLEETRRVLTARGLAIHIMPSVSWRAWSSAAQPVSDAGRILGHLGRRLRNPRRPQEEAEGSRHSRDSTEVGNSERGVWGRRLKALLPGAPHGEFPSAAHELLGYRRSAWIQLLARHDFTPVAVHGTGLFYTGYGLAPWIGIASRQRLARVLGSACTMIVVRR